MFLLFPSRIFDLLVQPIISAQIWRISSPVCDSSPHPIKILNGLVYIEYFAAIDDLLYELECLIYNLLSGFDACISSHMAARVIFYAHCALFFSFMRFC